MLGRGLHAGSIRRRFARRQPGTAREFRRPDCGSQHRRRNGFRSLSHRGADPLQERETRTVTIETAKGTIVMKIDGSLAPNAAGNFVALAECGFYDGVVFHRLVPNFVIRAATRPAPAAAAQYTIEDQEVNGEYKRGTLAMARTPEPDSQGSQFFIVLSDEPAGPILESNRTYAIFGEVIEGMDVVDAIAAMPNSGEPSNAALEPVAMDKLTVSNPSQRS